MAIKEISLSTFLQFLEKTGAQKGTVPYIIKSACGRDSQ